MRLWSIHPKYLDAKGLTACWREGLLARKVLLGETSGYQHHPQLQRFRAMPNPIEAIESYLYAILEEAQQRGYHFDATKLKNKRTSIQIAVTDGQLHYEWKHLKQKLETRAPEYLARLELTKKGEITESRDFISPHPIFFAIEGEIESWERNY